MPNIAPATSSNPQPLPVNRYSARSSYYGASGFHPSPGLERARKPFRAKNALTGLAILGFVGAVYGYSISAVKQDDFSDLPTVSTSAGMEGVKTIEEELAEKAKAGGGRGIGALMGYGSSPQGDGVRISVDDSAAAAGNTGFSSPQPTPLSTPLPPGPVPASSILSTGARPHSKIIVGAGNVDRLGTMGERRSDEPFVSGHRLV